MREIRSEGGGAPILESGLDDIAHGRQPNNIRYFNPQLYAADATLKINIKHFITFLKQEEVALKRASRQRPKKSCETFDHAVETIICNLLQITDVEAAELAIPLGNNEQRGNPHYRPKAYGKPFQDLLGGIRGDKKGLLIELGFVRVIREGHNIKQYNRQQPTTIRPTEKLRQLFPMMEVPLPPPYAFKIAAPPELIWLNNDKRRPVCYYDTPETKRWREELRDINAMLKAAPIELVPAPHNHLCLLDVGDIYLHRIFTGSWNRHGRLYGGFWIEMKKEDRKRLIRIGGEPICHVDYQTFNLRVLYAHAHKPFPFDHGRDPYKAGPGEREGWKEMTNAMLNRKAPRNGWPASSADERKKIASNFPEGTMPASVFAAIMKHHAPVAEWFDRGIGMELTRKESDLIVAVVLALHEIGIPCLPVHDCVIVAQSHAGIAQKVMESEAKRQLKCAIPAIIG